VEVIENVPFNEVYVSIGTRIYSDSGEHSIASTSVCSFPEVAGGRFYIDTI
jgi:hypothetical protein